MPAMIATNDTASLQKHALDALPAAHTIQKLTTGTHPAHQPGTWLLRAIMMRHTANQRYIPPDTQSPHPVE